MGQAASLVRLTRVHERERGSVCVEGERERAVGTETMRTGANAPHR